MHVLFYGRQHILMGMIIIKIIMIFNCCFYFVCNKRNIMSLCVLHCIICRDKFLKVP
jgi:hypothetical protein